MCQEREREKKKVKKETVGNERGRRVEEEVEETTEDVRGGGVLPSYFFVRVTEFHVAVGGVVTAVSSRLEWAIVAVINGPAVSTEKCPKKWKRNERKKRERK